MIPRRAAALLLAALLGGSALLLAAPPAGSTLPPAGSTLPADGALAADGAPAADGRLEAVAVRKTVVARADATGDVAEGRLVTRLVAAGEGPVEVVDPTSTDGLRDLDAVWPPRTRGGAAVWDLDLDGVAVRRSTARFPSDGLPVVVAARYELDGSPVAPNALSGASGEVTARFLVRNVTPERREIAYRTADGTHAEEVPVAVPLVGRLTADFGPEWQDLRSAAGTITATPDGAAATWTMGLFEPFGSHVHELEVTGTLAGGGLPDVVLDVAPVTTARSPELDTGLDLLEGVQSDAAVLGFGLEESHTALHDIADGVGALLDGLVELETGLGGLVGGLDDAAGGAGQLAGGAREVAGGAGQLAAGAGGAARGADELAGGLGELAGGADGVAGGVAGLAGGLEALGAGTSGLAGGIAELARGTDELARGVDVALTELENALAAAPDADLAPLLEALASAHAVLAGLESALADVGPISAALAEVVATSDAVLEQLEHLRDGLDEDDRALVDPAVAAVERIRATAAAALDDLAAVTGRLGARVSELAGAVGAILAQLSGLEEALTADPAELLAGLGQLRAATAELAGGTAELAVAAAGVDRGVAESAAGARQLAGGAGALAGGSRALATGSRELAGGLSDLAGGTEELAGGLGDLAAAAGGLAAGLAQLAGASDQLAAGIAAAVDGVGELEGGIALLADEAIDFLRRAADGASGSVARDLARIDALEARAADGVPYGFPEGAEASATYRIELAGEEPFRLPPAGRLAVGALLLAAAGALARATTRRTGLPV